MNNVAPVLIGIAALSWSVASPQDKGKKQAPDWVEITPERVESEKATRVMKLEDRLVFEIGFARGKSPFDGADQVSAHCHISNPTRKALKASLHLALFDKDKRLIAAAFFNWGNSDSFPAIKSGEKRAGMSMLLEAPTEQLDRIKYAQGRLYVKE